MKAKTLYPLYTSYRGYNKYYGSKNDRIYLSHDIKITLKSHFWCENVKVLPSFTQRYNRRHYSQARETLYTLVYMSCTWVALQVS